VIADGQIEIRSEAGGKSYSGRSLIPEVLLGAEGMRRLSLEKVKGPGDRVGFQTFSAETRASHRAARPRWAGNR